MTQRIAALRPPLKPSMTVGPSTSASLCRSLARAAIAIIGFTWIGVANADCLDEAAKYHRVDSMLLRSIAMQESGMRPWVTNRNANGSEDLGLMQINSIHLLRLGRYGITRAHLFDGCINAYVGAWILRENIQRFGPTWRAVGAYNASSPDKQLRYANQIHARWQALQRAALR